MIKSFEELGDTLAEFENRLAYLENSKQVLSSFRELEKTPIEIPEKKHAFGITSLDLKWREKEIKRVENQLEKLDGWVNQALRIIEAKKIPVTVVKLTQPDLEKMEASQWAAIRTLKNQFSSLKKLYLELQDKTKVDKQYKY